jgi:hypothetical protein
MNKIKIILLLFLFSLNLSAQDYKLSLQFDSILFRDLADTVEKLIPVRIFYSDKWVDTLKLDVKEKESRLDRLFERSLLNTGFSFYITDDNKLILSKGFIKTNFSREYQQYLKYRISEIDSVVYTSIAPTDEKSAINEEYKVFKIGSPSLLKKSGTATFAGKVINSYSGEPVPGAVVYVDKLKAGAVTNDAGYYSLELPKGQYQVEYRMIGLNTTRRNLIIYSSGSLDVGMTENTSQLNEVVVSADKENKMRSVRMGIEKVNVKMLKQMPLGLGEADLIKSSLMLPGVQSVGEASNGYNIRGGNIDQNLILFDGAPVINPSHFFGFFSAFNSDIIEDVTLYKSGMPAKYGGRVSSVMDIVLKEGSREKINVSGGISPYTGRLMIEGPLAKKSSSFIVSSRATYSDWILGMLKDPKLQRSSAGFYDVQGLLTFNYNAKNTVSISGYLSNDSFDYYKEFALGYSNRAATVKWYHSYNSRLFSTFAGIVTKYDYELTSDDDPATRNTLEYDFSQILLKADFTYFPDSRHKMDFGLDATYYTLHPGTQTPSGQASEIPAKTLDKERAIEPSLYFSDEIEFSPRVLVYGGLRLTFFTSFGPATRFIYNEGVTRSIDNISDTLHYKSGGIVKFYPGLEYRLSSRFILTTELSLKASIQRNYQYLNMISNTTSMSPTDIWKLSDYYIKPQRGDQFSIGLYRNLWSRTMEVSGEVYYKYLKNILDYKGGANLIMNEHLETDILSGKGQAYGIELMLKRQTGKITGWVSYTYARSFLKIDGPYEAEKINGGKYFPANFDKPHDLKLVANVKLMRRLNLTSNLLYNTGRPITYPVAYFNFYNVNRIFYSDRNEFRIPDYFRVDLSATVNGNLKARKLNHSTLTFTVYNVLGRKNPYSIYFKLEDGMVNGYQMSIFGKPIFMITYNFRIRGNASTDY